MDTIIHIPNYVDSNNTSNLFDVIHSQTNWNKLNYFKRSVSHYDGNINELNEIILQIEENFDKMIHSAFLNYYENGNDYAPYHSDNYGCDVCLLSLGTSRILRYKENKTKQNTDFILNDGDLLYIPNELNKTYKHSLLKRTKIESSRISILFFLKEK